MSGFMNGSCVVRRRAFDIAVFAGKIAQGTRVEPQRFESAELDMRTRFAFGRDPGMAEFFARERHGIGEGKG